MEASAHERAGRFVVVRHPLRTEVDRRRFLQATWRALGAAVAVSLLPARRGRAVWSYGMNPFALGVASGDPTPDGIVLWTRLVRDVLDPASLGKASVPVRFRVASDSQMREVVASGMADAQATLAHSVHVDVRGLGAGRDHWYQFDVGGEESPVGHFRTAPAHDADVAQLRFALATCQDWASGHYPAYRDMTEQDPDFVLHLGDYTYEYAIAASRRQGAMPEGFAEACVDLRTYRLRHALHKLDPDLQAIHRASPFVAIWDDHEVSNDYAGLAPEGAPASPAFAARRAAAYQAYYEHMPIRCAPEDVARGDVRVHRRLRFGKLAELTLLDDRQYRTDNPCGDGESLRCPAALTDEPTMLGRAQETWVTEGFRAASARWNLIGQQVLLAELEHRPLQEGRYWNDAWDGYPRARGRLFDALEGTRVSNPVFFTGDWHSTFVNDLKRDFKQPSAPVLATEFVTPAITSGGDDTPYGPYYGPMVPFNPHIRYFEGDKRGYFLATLRPSQLRMDLRFAERVSDPNARVASERAFVVEDGKPGAQSA